MHDFSLVFKGDHGNTREIATIKVLNDLGQPKTDQDILAEANLVIRAFCTERNFRIYYTRIWNRDNTTIFDVGSHTEFFHLTPKVNLDG